MTQTSHSTPSSGTPRARPQLFGSQPPQQPDFENSILATIDGGQARLTRKTRRPRKSKIPALLLGLALLGAGLYAASHVSPQTLSFAWLQAKVTEKKSASSPATPQAAPAPVETEPSPVAPPAGATIEVLPVPAAEVASSAPPAQAMTALEASDSALASPGPASTTSAESDLADAVTSPALLASATPPKTSASAVATAPPPVAPTVANKTPTSGDAGRTSQAKTRASEQSTSKPRPAKKPATQPQSDTESDAALLAAMLPHFQRPEPTSPAFEKRCGKASGSAAIACRERFCSGRVGVDAACPDPSTTPLPASAY